MAKLKPARTRKKQQAAAFGRGRLIGCVVIMAGLLFLFFLLMSRVLQNH